MTDEALKATFPIQEVGSIPMVIAERAYERYTQLYGQGQTLQRLAARGGFGLSELGFLLRGHGKARQEDDRDWHHCCEHATKEILKALTARLADVEAERDQQQWQPIETAPKDDGYLCLLWWPSRFTCPVVGFWSTAIVQSGRWCVDDAYEPDDEGQPTHCMPLPASPPSPQADQET